MRILKKSFRNRLFAAMLLCSLIPLLICTVLMVQITRLRLDSKTREDGAEQSAALLGSMDFISNALTSAAARLQDTETAIHGLGAGIGNRLQINSLLFDATDTFRNLAVFDLYDSAGQCRYSTRGTVSADLRTELNQMVFPSLLYSGPSFSPGALVSRVSAPPVTGQV